MQGKVLPQGYAGLLALEDGSMDGGYVQMNHPVVSCGGFLGVCRHHLFAVAFSCMALFALLPNASAQQGEDGDDGDERTAKERLLEELVVTAQRVEQSVQEVPISVSALPASVIEDRQIINPSDLQLNVPNVSFTATNFGNSSFSIRGVGRLVISASGESGVSTHINEIPIVSDLNATEFFDVGRLEVLRGPQGTLFGRNATGGSINQVVNLPQFTDDTWGGFADVELGSHSHRRLKGAINLALSERLSFRAAAMHLKRDGYTENLAAGQIGTNRHGQGLNPLQGIDDDIDGRDYYAFRLIGRFQTERSDLWVMYSRFDEDDDRARITNQVCKRTELPVSGCEADEFGLDPINLGSSTGTIFAISVGALPPGVKGIPGEAGVHYDFPRPNIDGLREIHTDFEPVFKGKEDVFAFGFEYELQAHSIGILGAYQEAENLSRMDYNMDVGVSLHPTSPNAQGVSANPQGIYPTSEPAGRAGEDWTDSDCNYQDGTSGVFGGCVHPYGDQTRVFSYDQSDSASEYWTLEARISSSYQGDLNFTAGVSAFNSEAHGDYYVISNTLDLVGSYPNLFGPPLYPTMFNSARDEAGNNTTEGFAIFGELYYDLSDDLRLTVGARYNDDRKEVSDSGVLYNSIDLGAAVPGVPARTWVRGAFIPFITAGAPIVTDSTAAALLEFWGVDVALFDAQSQAVANDPAVAASGFSDRLELAQRVGPVPAPNENRFLTNSPTESDWQVVTGRVALDWQLTPDNLLYGVLSLGYKPGGFNPPLNEAFQTDPAFDFTFDEERATAFEVGSKNVLLDGQVLLNASAFYYTYEDLQVTRIANNSSLNENIDANIVGLELEGQWKPEAVPGLAVDFSYSWLNTSVDGASSIDPLDKTASDPGWLALKNIDPGSLTAVVYVAKESALTPAVIQALKNATVGVGILPGTNDLGYERAGSGYPDGVIPVYISRGNLSGILGSDAAANVSDGLPTDLDGNQLPNSPEHTIHIGLAYTLNLPILQGGLTARWDLYWQGESYAREFNTKGDEIDAWDQHNLSLIWESNNGRLTARAWVRNVFDEENVTGKYLTADTTGFYRNYFLTEPRIFGLSVRATL